MPQGNCSPNEELNAFLRSPASYPHEPDEVELVQTHISYVALAGRYVYKVKKPLDLGFLDFSTLEQRKHFCEEEIRLNRRLCPDVYEAVVPIYRTDGGPAIEGPVRRIESRMTFDGALAGADGEVVEYAVRMKRLKDGAFLHQRLERGEPGTAELDRVTETLAEFYRAHPATPEAARWGRLDALRYNADENFGQTGPHVASLLSRPAFAALQFYTNRFLDANACLLARRRADGRVLEGHGDLRLEHIHLTTDGVCIFDCIVFNERIRCVDVANEAAFLAMDLNYHGRPDLARYWIGKMAEVLDDPELPLLAPFYGCYRACVRGKVAGMRAVEEQATEEERKTASENARRHYRLALQFAVTGMTPAVIAVMGRTGAGKTTQAQALAGAAGFAHLSSDVIRKTKAGVPLDRRATADERERLYLPERTEEVYRELREQALANALEYRCTVIDATYGSLGHREELRRHCAQHDLPLFFIELTADDGALRERLKERSATESASDARLEDFEMLSEKYEPPDALEDARHARVDAGDAEEATTLEVLKAIIRLGLLK